MSEESVVNVKHRMLELFSEMDEADIETIEQWICQQSYRRDLDRLKALKSSQKTLVKIANSIKKIVPFEAEMPSEIIKPPTVGDQADCNETNTCHVDEFLYDDNEVDKLVKKGKLKKYYCTNCNHRDVKELIYISHSMSCQALQYIFKVLLPSDLEEKQILDVGSRLGAVLYGAYYLSNAGTIIGVEMNEECCDIQRRMIEQYTMDTNRIRVVHSDVMERSDLKAEPTQFLQLHGRPCKIHLDPAIAAAGEGPAIMMPWQGDTNNMIDRFDVRAHLDYIPEVRYPEIPPEELSPEERQCNYERYRILAQNVFLGISEDKFLQQLAIEEQFGVTIEEKEHQKEKLHEKKGTGAAIGYNYNDPGAQPSGSNGPDTKKVEQKDSDDDSDLEIIDVDLSIDVNKMEASQAHELNGVGPQFGMAGCDLFSFLTGDADDAEHQKQLLREEKEKAMFSGRKSRRERRAHRCESACYGVIILILQRQEACYKGGRRHQAVVVDQLAQEDPTHVQDRFRDPGRAQGHARGRVRGPVPSLAHPDPAPLPQGQGPAPTALTDELARGQGHVTVETDILEARQIKLVVMPSVITPGRCRLKGKLVLKFIIFDCSDKNAQSKPAVPRYYGRRKEDQSSSELSIDSDSSESDQDAKNKMAVGNKSNTNQNQLRLSGSSSKVIRADKRAEAERQERESRRQARRDEEMRELAIKIRRKESLSNGKKREDKSKSRSASPPARIPVWETNRDFASTSQRPRSDYSMNKPREYGENSYYSDRRRYQDQESKDDRRNDEDRSQYYSNRYDKYPSREQGQGRYDNYNRYENHSYEGRWKEDGYNTGRRRPYGHRGGYRGHGFRHNEHSSSPSQDHDRDTAEGYSKNKVKLVDY
ncbi:hypothetical protein HF086_005535 [Spodoptera exigua]|uniref:Suppressor of white apricot N-terminal domain-containing protein n=1 Tax=Spodoptera exigua TaxID=7107 RepID=A0A922MRI1_SPOEX|nr:hypothetical protein HF086_005535 [Spodoptera exigua]